MRARYVILCNAYGGVLNDPILLRISKDEFWFSLSDSDIGMYLQGVNADGRFDCTIEEIDVCPVQIQGPKSKALIVASENPRSLKYGSAIERPSSESNNCFLKNSFAYSRMISKLSRSF